MPEHDILEEASVVLVVQTQDVPKFMRERFRRSIEVDIHVADDLWATFLIGFLLDVNELVVMAAGVFLGVNRIGTEGQAHSPEPPRE